MLNKLNDDEIESRRASSNYVEYKEIEELLEVDNEEIDESGFSFLDKDNKVISMFMNESKDDTVVTMKKVVAVCDLGEEEIKKMDKVRHIIKGFLEICFRKKVSVFLLAMAFLFMFGMGIKEKMLALCIMYSWGFFTITETGKAIKFIKDTLEEYKLHEEVIHDESLLEFIHTEITDDIEDVRLYLMKKSK